jgi:hypothetical protein
MWTLPEIVKSMAENHAEVNGRWVAARPLVGSLWSRLRDAWEVIRARADAFIWPEGQ